MPERFRPSRLALARMLREYTKTALAAECPISARSLSAYENERTIPGHDTVADLAEALGFPTEFFYRPAPPMPDRDSVSFRALTRTSAARRDAVCASAGLAIELDRWIDEEFRRPDPSVPDLGGQEPEVAAEALRAQWGVGQCPIPNMIHLLEAHGVRVYSLPPQSRGLDAVSLWWEETPFIFLNTASTAERSRYDSAHELGHLVLHRHGGPEGREAEREANAFAGAFLVPEKHLRATVPRRRQLSEIIEAKRTYRVSAMAYVYRLHEVGLLSDWHYRQLCIRIRSRFGDDEPNPVQRESSQILAKVFSWLRRSGVSRKAVAQQQHITVEDLDNLIFSLVLTPILGGGSHSFRSREPPDLRVL